MPKTDTRSTPKTDKRKIDTKWFNDRMGELGLSNAALAPEFGVAPNKLWQMKTGNRAVQCDELLIWARVLQVHPSEIFRRLGLQWPEHAVPIIGHIRPNGRIERQDGGATAPAPADRCTASVALVALRSMGPAVHAGATLYYAPSNGIDVSAFGRLSVLGFGDQPEPILGVLESAALGQAKAVVPGTGEVVYTDQAISAAPVLWIKAG